MATLLRGLGLGAVFGLAARIVEGGLVLVPILQRRLSPGTDFLLETALFEVALGAVLGLAAAPLLRLRRGSVVHVLAIALAWAVLQKWVELDSPIFTRLQLAIPAGGGLLALLGLWMGRGRPWLPIGIAFAALAVTVAVPGVCLSITTPAVEARAVVEPVPGAPDIVLVVLDTIRARNVSTYGYARPTAPTLDALALEGALFLDATSPSTWSLPSHASLFTGRYPSGHGAHFEHHFLDDTFPTLAEVLASRGYEALCFTANPWISDALGLTRGFTWQDRAPVGEAGRQHSFIFRLIGRLGFEPDDKGGDLVASRIEAWARERPEDARPAFVFINFLEAHFPYHQVPRPYLARFTDQPRSGLRQITLDLLATQFGGRLEDPEAAAAPARDMYDAGVLYSDALLSRVVEAVRRRGRLDQTILVVLADHGELLGERGDFFGHGVSLYQPMVRVPLLVRYPPVVPAGAQVERPVSTAGVYGTILDLARIPLPPTLQVGSLVPAIGGGEAGGPVLSEVQSAAGMMGGLKVPSDASPLMRPDTRLRLYRDGPWKLIETSRGDTALFDLRADPDETVDLSFERPDVVARLERDLERVRAELGLRRLDAEVSEAAPELDEATRERLRALGYAE